MEILDSIKEDPITIYHIGLDLLLVFTVPVWYVLALKFMHVSKICCHTPATGNEWWDLCAGPHVDSTGHINKKAVQLESVAGAYWRGDESRPMLQRIYGTAWESEEQLKAYIHFKEEAKRRDHRRLGQDLDLFSIQVSEAFF